eukprot:SAG22_NODE_146_length_17566_cov_17.597847_10_plen_413_part_00
MCCIMKTADAVLLSGVQCDASGYGLVYRNNSCIFAGRGNGGGIGGAAPHAFDYNSCQLKDIEYPPTMMTTDNTYFTDASVNLTVLCGDDRIPLKEWQQTYKQDLGSTVLAAPTADEIVAMARRKLASQTLPSDANTITPANDITRYGAIPNDGKDDTAAIQAALDGCVAAGGVVVVPAGEFTISLPNHTRQVQLDLCLAIPSDCTLRGAKVPAGAPAASGAHARSTLKFADAVNVNGWWRMLGPRLATQAPSLGSAARQPAEGGTGSAHNITIEDLHLDGSTNHTEYPCTITAPGYPHGYAVCEHNSLIFFYTNEGTIVNVTVQRLEVEAIAGDCMDFGNGVQNLLVQDIVLRDYLRQGIDVSADTFSIVVSAVVVFSRCTVDAEVSPFSWPATHSPGTTRCAGSLSCRGGR